MVYRPILIQEVFAFEKRQHWKSLIDQLWLGISVAFNPAHPTLPNWSNVSNIVLHTTVSIKEEMWHSPLLPCLWFKEDPTTYQMDGPTEQLFESCEPLLNNTDINRYIASFANIQWYGITWMIMSQKLESWCFVAFYPLAASRFHSKRLLLTSQVNRLVFWSWNIRYLKYLKWIDWYSELKYLISQTFDFRLRSVLYLSLYSQYWIHQMVAFTFMKLEIYSYVGLVCHMGL